MAERFTHSEQNPHSTSTSSCSFIKSLTVSLENSAKISEIPSVGFWKVGGIGMVLTFAYLFASMCSSGKWEFLVQLPFQPEEVQNHLLGRTSLFCKQLYWVNQLRMSRARISGVTSPFFLHNSFIVSAPAYSRTFVSNSTAFYPITVEYEMQRLSCAPECSNCVVSYL